MCVSFRTNNTISKYIKNNKSKVDKNKKSGVYKLNCGSCPKFYIGRTHRNFSVRISEHQRNFIKQNSYSTYANHLLDEHHLFNDNFEILHIENNLFAINNLEYLEINKFKYSANLLNDQTDMNNSPLLNIFA